VQESIFHLGNQAECFGDLLSWGLYYLTLLTKINSIQLRQVWSIRRVCP